MGTFKNMGGNIPGGNFLGGNFSGGIHQGGVLLVGHFPWEFPDTEENICEEFLGVYALTLIIIIKIFILQTDSLRV